MTKAAPYAEFGEKLMELRKKAKMTRAELGEICGVVSGTIVNYEKGTRIPYANTALRMADHFHITMHELLCVENPELAMAQAQALDQMRSIHGKKGADRLSVVLAEAGNLAGDDLTDEQLLEFSLEMTKMAQLAQQRLTERYTNKRYQDTVERKAQQTEAIVRYLNEQIIELASKHQKSEEI